MWATLTPEAVTVRENLYRSRWISSRFCTVCIHAMYCECEMLLIMSSRFHTITEVRNLYCCTEEIYLCLVNCTKPKVFI